MPEIERNRFNVSVRVPDPHHFNVDPDPAFNFNADPDPAFHFNAVLNPAPYITAMPICNRWPTDPPGLCYEPPSLYFEHPRPSTTPF